MSSTACCVRCSGSSWAGSAELTAEACATDPPEAEQASRQESRAMERIPLGIRLPSCINSPFIKDKGLVSRRPLYQSTCVTHPLSFFKWGEAAFQGYLYPYPLVIKGEPGEVRVELGNLPLSPDVHALTVTPEGIPLRGGTSREALLYLVEG